MPWWLFKKILLKYIQKFQVGELQYIWKALIIRNNPLQFSNVKIWLSIPKPAHYTISATKCLGSEAEAEQFIREVSKYLAGSFARIIATN